MERYAYFGDFYSILTALIGMSLCPGQSLVTSLQTAPVMPEIKSLLAACPMIPSLYQGFPATNIKFKVLTRNNTQ